MRLITFCFVTAMSIGARAQTTSYDSKGRPHVTNGVPEIAQPAPSKGGLVTIDTKGRVHPAGMPTVSPSTLPEGATVDSKGRIHR
jgi:hypothetical protein